MNTKTFPVTETEVLPWTHLSGDVGLGAGVGVEPRDGQLRVGERGAAAPQLLLGARVQLETVLQYSQFLHEQERQTGDYMNENMICREKLGH